MFGYAILAFVCTVIVISIAILVGYFIDNPPKIGEGILLSLLAMACIVLGLCSLKSLFQSEVKTYDKPKIEMQVTTKIADGQEKSDTLYIYRFNK